MTKIYGLFDPRNNELRYVGKTSGLISQRLSGHASDAKKSRLNSPKIAWMRQLAKLGLRPIIETLEECPEADHAEAESFYIEYLRSLGARLTNIQPGGDGQPRGFKFKNRHSWKTGHVSWNKGVHGYNINFNPATAAALKEKFRNRVCKWLHKPIISENITTGEILEFPTAVAASKTLGVARQTICNFLKGRSKTAKGFRFTYGKIVA